MAKKKKKLHAHRSLVTLGMILAPRSTKLRDKRDRRNKERQSDQSEWS